MPSSCVIDPDGTGDYTSLAAAISGEGGDLSGAGVVVFKLQCTGGTADTPGSVVSGFTNADSSNYLKIWTDPAESYRYNGTWQTGNIYRIENASDYTQAIDNQTAYTRIIGVPVSLGSNQAQGFGSAIDNPFYFDKCLVKGYGTGEYSYGFYVRGLSGQGIVRNSIAYYTYSGFKFDDYYYPVFQNCTAANCVNGFGPGAVDNRPIVVNCVSYNNTNEFHTPANWDQTNSKNNAVESSDSNDAPGANSVTSVASTDFNAYESDDFHLSSGSNLRGVGFDLSGTFTDDIDGDTRSAWDIGADEYVAPAGLTEFVMPMFLPGQ